MTPVDDWEGEADPLWRRLRRVIYWQNPSLLDRDLLVIGEQGRNMPIRPNSQ